MANPGIDYGMGLVNVDRATGIRYGVISQGSILCEALDEFEAEYPEVEHDEDCDNHDSCDCGCHNEPIGYRYERNGYVLSMGTDGFGIFVLKSPYYTHAAFCSPCAPGAGNLDSPIEGGIRTYALGADWFEDNQTPYVLCDVKVL